MANAKEVALGITSVLGSTRSPDPLPITFRGQALPEAAAIVIAIVHECRDADIALNRVVVDPELYQEVRSRAPHLDAQTVSDGSLEGVALFYRHEGSPEKETP